MEKPETEANKDLFWCRRVGIPTLFFKCPLEDSYVGIIHKMFLVNRMFISETSISSKQTITFSIILYTFLFREWVSTLKKKNLFQCGKLENTERPKGNSSVDSAVSMGAGGF